MSSSICSLNFVIFVLKLLGISMFKKLISSVMTGTLGVL